MNKLQDTMMRDIDMPLHRSPVEPSFCSRSTEDLFSSPTPNLFNKKISPVPDYDMFEDIFEDEELFGKERRKNIWKGSILDPLLLCTVLPFYKIYKLKFSFFQNILEYTYYCFVGALLHVLISGI